MTARQAWPAGVALSALILLAASAAHAQDADPDCKDLSSETERDDIMIARTWLPLQIAFEAMNSACKAHKFLGNVFSKEPDPEKITPDDVFEAAKPEGSDSGDAAFKAAIKKQPSVSAKPGWNPEPTAQYVVLPPINPDGPPSLFQPNGATGGTAPKSIGEIDGNGTLLTPEGMKRGTFADGKLEGIGEEIDPDGVWRSGTYEAGTNVGYMFEVRTIDGTTYLAAGSVVNGKLDGMVERIYADGSRQFEEWDKGQFVQVGVRAPKGQSPIAPQPKAGTMASRDAAPDSGGSRTSAPAPGAASSGRQTTGTYGGNYATLISEPALPASFYARYTGHGLTKDQCVNQLNALGWDPTTFGGSDVLLLRATIASLEASIIIIRQCENNPQAVVQMQFWATQRKASIATCRQISTNPGICLQSPF